MKVSEIKIVQISKYKYQVSYKNLMLVTII